ACWLGQRAPARPGGRLARAPPGGSGLYGPSSCASTVRANWWTEARAALGRSRGPLRARDCRATLAQVVRGPGRGLASEGRAARKTAQDVTGGRWHVTT